MASSPSDTPFASFRKALEEAAEHLYDYNDPRELVDIIWLAMERANQMPQTPAPPEGLSSEEEEQDMSLPSGLAPTAPPPLTSQPEMERSEETEEEDDQVPLVEDEQQSYGSPLPVFLSAPSPLENARALRRALYPLTERFPSPYRSDLDEEATVTESAEQDMIIPVLRPKPERWLELALVIEETSILAIWQDTITAFQKLTEGHGAFRNVKTWYLRDDGLSKISLVRGSRSGPPPDSAKPHAPKELSDPAGRCLIVVMSDCTSDLWNSNALPRQLADWSRQMPVTVLQLMPDTHWENSVLGQGYGAWFKTQIRGPRNAVLKPQGLSQRQRQNLKSPRLKSFDLLQLPVITLDEDPLREWAKVMAGLSKAETAGIILGVPKTLEAEFQQRVRQGSEQQSSTPEALVANFWSTASSEARQLAGMMARQQVSLPVIRLLQRQLLGNQDPMILAEIFLSGLISAKKAEPAFSTTLEGGRGWDYHFAHEDIRQLLFKATPLSVTQQTQQAVVQAIEGYLPQEIQQRINQQLTQLSRKIEEQIQTNQGQNLGLSHSQFRAFVLPCLFKKWWDQQKEKDPVLGEIIRPLATLSVSTLEAMGGDWAKIADTLREPAFVERQVFVYQAAEPPSEEHLPEDPPLILMDLAFTTVQLLQPVEAPAENPFPALEVEQFTVARFSLEDDILQPFEFTTATIRQTEAQAPRRKGQSAREWVIERQQATAYRLIEALPEEVTLEMVQIPEGSFQMGSDSEEPERRANESPQHKVTVPTFLMGRYPITQAQWRVVAQMDSVERDLSANPSHVEGEDRPVERVNWYDAVEFCQRLSRHSGRTYRLPSEAEWEYACRAGTTTPFHFGEMLLTDVANYHGTSYNDGPQGQRRGKTTSVGEFPANAWGLYDMHGNVWEWCQDHYHDSYQGAPTDGSAWLKDNSKRKMHVQRGGAWDFSPRNCRSAFRSGFEPGNAHDDVGFRVVCVAPRT